MGGHAFEQAVAPGQQQLRTPRMSPETYTHLKQVYVERLGKYFPGGSVATLIEAPEKIDYGDIDVIVSYSGNVDFLELACQVGARAIIRAPSGKVQRCTMAVPRDGEKYRLPPIEYQSRNVQHNQPATDSEKTEMNQADQYAQLDVEILVPEIFPWFQFYASYGDLAGLLGRLARHYGFTVTDKGLYMRLQELENAKEKEWLRIANHGGILFLGNDPDMVMEFSGLPIETYKSGFKTTSSFYEWLAQCRFLSVELANTGRDTSSERQKERKRGVYASFFDEWLPAHFKVDTGTPVDRDSDKADPAVTAETPTSDQIGIVQEPSSAKLSSTSESASVASSIDAKIIKKRRLCFSDRREQYQREAIEFFDKEEEFQTMREALVLIIRNQTAEHFLKPIVAEHAQRTDRGITEIVRAFRRWVVFCDDMPQVAETPHADHESQLHHWVSEDQETLKNSETSSEWVNLHWNELRERERQHSRNPKSGKPDNTTRT